MKNIEERKVIYSLVVT